MKMTCTRLHIYLLLTAWLLALTAGAQTADLSPVAEFAASPDINDQRSAVMIIDLKTGKTIDAHNADTPLIPASVTKAVTIASTLGKTGLMKTYETTVSLTGPVKDGIVKGNLLITGGGDPTLGADVEPYPSDIIAEITSALKKRDIKAIDGRIIINSGYFEAPATPLSWAAGDKARDYGAPVYGFNYRRNASGGKSLQDPAGQFVRELTSHLSRTGISVAGSDQYGDRPQGKPLLRHLSPPIDDIMRSCMRRSDNMYAETFLRTFAKAEGLATTPQAGADREMELWRRRGAHMNGVTLVDGSGLSRSNRMTARFLADVLTSMAGNVDYVSYFPLAGQEGTLRKFLKDTPLDGYIAMKTGSMNGVQCYAGYLLDDNYAPTHVVVILINDFPHGRDAAKRAAQQMLLDTFRK